MSQDACGWSFQNARVLPSKITLLIFFFLIDQNLLKTDLEAGSLLSSSYVEPNLCCNIILSIMLEQGVTIRIYLIWEKDYNGKELVGFAQGQGSHLHPERFWQSSSFILKSSSWIERYKINLFKFTHILNITPINADEKCTVLTGDEVT